MDIGEGFNLDDMTVDAWVLVDPARNAGDRRVISKDGFVDGERTIDQREVLALDPALEPASGVPRDAGWRPGVRDGRLHARQFCDRLRGGGDAYDRDVATVEDLIAEVMGRVRGPTFDLWVPDALMLQGHPVDHAVAMAVLLDAMLGEGLVPEGFTAEEGGRTYHYKIRDKPPQ